MLKQRVITALILAPMVIASVLFLPNSLVALMLAFVVALGAREWANMSGVSKSVNQWLYALGLVLIMALGYFLLPQLNVTAIVGVSVAWWVIALFRLSRYQGESGITGMEPLRLIEGVLVLVPAWLSLVVLHQVPGNGPLLLLFLLMLIWGADVGAYFAGRLWGHTKLAPKVSPGKTREGVYGAMAVGLCFGLILVWWLKSEPTQSLVLLTICLVTLLFSVVGDLFESLLKRRRGIKDSGVLLPGHGGMMDRIDSLTAASPLFLFGLMLLGEVT